MNKLYSIQVFRGLAAVMVLLAHSNLMLNRALFSGTFITGYVGVDFFFVLSGFIIMLTCKKKIGSGSVVEYIRKRVVRVFPVYIIYTAIAVFIDFVYIKWTGTGIITWVNINALSFIKSISLYPMDTDVNSPPILPVAWTLTYEMIFYTLFASLFFIHRKLIIIILTMAWIALIVINNIKDISGGDFLAYAFLSLRNLEFIMGCAMAYFISHHVNWKISAISLFFGFIMLITAWVNTTNGVSITGLSNWAAFGIPFSLIIFGVTRLEGVVRKNDGAFTKFLVYLGDASYSIYLVHFIVIMICRRTIFGYGMTIGFTEFWLVSLVALVVSLLMYETIEKPIMRWLNRPKPHAMNVA